MLASQEIRRDLSIIGISSVFRVRNLHPTLMGFPSPKHIVAARPSPGILCVCTRAPIILREKSFVVGTTLAPRSPYSGAPGWSIYSAVPHAVFFTFSTFSSLFRWNDWRRDAPWGGGNQYRTGSKNNEIQGAISVLINRLFTNFAVGSVFFRCGTPFKSRTWCCVFPRSQYKASIPDHYYKFNVLGVADFTAEIVQTTTSMNKPHSQGLGGSALSW